MGGYSNDPRTRLGLIALLAARRVKAEKMRREKAVDPASHGDAESTTQAKAKTRKAGWFR